jgi:hypothetical protein
MIRTKPGSARPFKIVILNGEKDPRIFFCLFLNRNLEATHGIP